MTSKQGVDDMKQEESIAMSDETSTDQDSDDNVSKRDNWSSQMDYLLTVVGYCVALGNFWRFPYICNRNGGGAFLIPFVVCLVLCGLPLFFMEVALGQFSGKSPTHVWSLCPLMKGIGISMLIISGGTVVYYTAICAWSLYYVVFSCRADLPWTSCQNTWNTEACVASVKILKQGIGGDMNVTETEVSNSSTVSTPLSHNFNNSVIEEGWKNDSLSHTAAEEFWHYQALSISSGINEMGDIKWELALCLLGSWIIILLCVIKGVRSVGKAVYVTATLPYIILIILFVRGLTLPGGPSGALLYITPNFSKLMEMQVWLEACLQVFYSLGPAWGGLITMASYNRFHTNCMRNAIICTFVSEGTSMFAGLVVFSILGFMAHEADVPVADIVSSGPGLGFVIYPEALAQLPVPQLWSFIFFIMLILLALDSLFSMVETVLSAIWDEYPSLLKWRVPITIVYCVISYLLGLVFVTNGGMYAFQLVDWYFVAIFLIFAGFLECVIIGWIYGVKRFSADIEMMIGRQPPVFFKITWCYITPCMLLTTFIFTLYQYKPPNYGHYQYPEYASSIGWCIASVPMVPLVGMMFVAIYKGKGSLLQRFRQSLTPERSWGPSKVSYRELYQEKAGRSSTLTQTCIASVSCRSESS